MKSLREEFACVWGVSSSTPVAFRCCFVRSSPFSSRGQYVHGGGHPVAWRLSPPSQRSGPPPGPWCFMANIIYTIPEFSKAKSQKLCCVVLFLQLQGSKQSLSSNVSADIVEHLRPQEVLYVETTTYSGTSEQGTLWG